MTNVSAAQSQNHGKTGVDDGRRLTRVGNEPGSEFMIQSTRERRPADIDRLLVRTSRTFALAIPLLPEPLRREVGVAYLLFRIADTFVRSC